MILLSIIYRQICPLFLEFKMINKKEKIGLFHRCIVKNKKQYLPASAMK